MTQSSRTHFINVDLDVRAPSGVLTMVRALEPKADALHSTDQLASFELGGGEGPFSVEEGISGLLALLELLPSSARAVWDACTQRDMNVGIQAGAADPTSTYFELSPELLRRMAALDIRLIFTVYLPEREDDQVIESENVKAVRKAGLLP